MGHHNGSSVGDEGKPGKDHREAQAADSQWGWCPFQPTESLHSRDGATLNGHFAFTLAKHHNFKRQPKKFLPHLVPSSPSSFPGEWNGWRIFVPW